MKNFKVCIKELRGVYRPVRGKVLVSVLIGLAGIAASLAFVWICKLLVDIATGAVDKPLTPHIIIMLALILVQILCFLGANYWENLIVVKTQNGMRHDIFGHMLRSTWTGREPHHSGDLVNRLEEDVRVVVDLICVRFPDIIVTIFQLLASSIYLFVLAPDLLWLLLGLMVVAIVGSRMFFRTLRRLTQAIRESDSKAQQHMQENLQNRVLVLTLIGAERVLTKLGAIQKDIQDNTVLRLNYNAVARGFMSFGFRFGYAAALLWGVLGIKNGTVTFGMMTAFLQLVGQVQRPIADLARHVPAFIHALTSIERIGELSDLPLEESGEEKIFTEAPEIRIDNVHFAYEGQKKPVFDGFSCVFPAGSISEISGPTGIGKSTLIRLVLALLKPEAGTITIGGQSVSPATRGNFMYVPQGNSLMSGTIRENLLLADPDASEERMMEALHFAAADFVAELADGLDARCGEDGSGLSEGQSQRIAVARALLCKGSVLVLDEATSALDPATESVLLENIRSCCHGVKTVLFISHRESVSAICDQIISL